MLLAAGDAKTMTKTAENVENGHSGDVVRTDVNSSTCVNTRWIFKGIEWEWRLRLTSSRTAFIAALFSPRNAKTGPCPSKG